MDENYYAHCRATPIQWFQSDRVFTQYASVDVNLNVYTRTSIESRLEAVGTLASAFVN